MLFNTYQPMIKYKGKEEDFQKAVKKYLDALGLFWFHPPNEIRANKTYLKKRSSLGVKKGVSDVIILEPRGVYHGLFIELKVGSNKPSPEQLNFIEIAKSKGYKAMWSRSLDEVINTVEEYLNQK